MAVYASQDSFKQSGASDSRPASDELLLASRELDGGYAMTELSVPGAHCGGCIATVERALSDLDGVVSARLNLTTRRAAIKWRRSASVPPLIEALSNAGFEAHLSSPDEAETDPQRGRLFRATAVAGFAAMNVMLLSVSVWAGADAATRQTFHLLSAFIAIPAVAYSGRVFFESAWSALRSGRSNMDVPISIGILLTVGLSLHETLREEAHAYFDAATSLVFFLLIGRTLEHLMRRKARTAVLGLARMMPRGASVLVADGSTRFTSRDKIAAGDLVLVAPGDRVPLDGNVANGVADIDASTVTGESAAVTVQEGDAVLAGMLNLNGSLVIRVEHTSESSFVADMIRLMEAAEIGRAGYRRLADRAARLYSPVVHSLGGLAFLGWIAATGDWHRALTIAISVLIITCPCALGLAVPMVQVAAARRLFERGIALKDGSALERLAEVDTIVFDKTGTLTTGDATIAKAGASGSDLDAACALASKSRHPVSRAIASLSTNSNELTLESFAEQPGKGLEGRVGPDRYRLGRPEWALDGQADSMTVETGPVLTRNGVKVGHFELTDPIRPEAPEVLRALCQRGFRTEILSGDTASAVAQIAAIVGADTFLAGQLPGEKVERLDALKDEGRRVLMVGDGLNDAPALAAAHVSMAPASAAEVGRAAADLVFFRQSLAAVTEALEVAHEARRLVRQNLALAIGYNAVVIPIALAGLVTPLMAAVAMSSSSIVVIVNALRISRCGTGDRLREGIAVRAPRHGR